MYSHSSAAAEVDTVICQPPLRIASFSGYWTRQLPGAPESTYLGGVAQEGFKCDDPAVVCDHDQRFVSLGTQDRLVRHIDCCTQQSNGRDEDTVRSLPC